MTNKEADIVIKKIKERRVEILKSKESATGFLIKVGIITKKGNLRKPYRA